MGIGLIFLIGSTRFGLGDLGEPGPGFFPFLMSVSLITFSLIHFSSSLRKEGQPGPPVSLRFWPKGRYMIRLAFIMFLLFMFILSINYLGFVLTTFFFMVLLLRFIEARRLRTVLLIATLTTARSYAIFELWLKANMPRGFLGF